MNLGFLSVLLSSYLLISLTASAQAQEKFRVHNEVLLQRHFFSESASTYEVNKKLGLARLSLAFGIAHDEDSAPYFKPVQIEGLFYDANSKSVVYRNPTTGTLTICATFRRFGGELKKTKSCKFIPRNLQQSLNNGFDVQKTTRLIVDFEVSQP